MPHGWAKPISAISAISAGLKKSIKFSGTEKIIGANKQTNEQFDSKCHMSQMSQNASLLMRLSVFRDVRTVRSFVCSFQTRALQTMALCAINYGSFCGKVPQTLIAGTSFSGSGNVKRW